MLAILIPVLNRPQNVAPLIESIYASTPGPYRVLWICDPGDVAQQDAIAREGGEMISPGGNYASKINMGFNATTEAWVFLAADDLRFHPDWLPNALSHATDDIGVIGTNDLCNPRVIRGTHSTHSLVRRSYIELEGVIDEPGKVLHEGYYHEYCDDEMVQTAMKRGRYVHAHNSIVEHLHPLVNKAEDDDTYRKGRQHTRQSRRRYFTRRHMWK